MTYNPKTIFPKGTVFKVNLLVPLPREATYEQVFQWINELFLWGSELESNNPLYIDTVDLLQNPEVIDSGLVYNRTREVLNKKGHVRIKISVMRTPIT